MSLDHLHASVSHLVDVTSDVNHLLLLHLFQDDISGYKCACTPNTSTVGCGEVLSSGASGLLVDGAYLQ